jgi:hypothetical protein
MFLFVDFYKIDVTSWDDQSRCFQAALKEFGRLDYGDYSDPLSIYIFLGQLYLLTASTVFAFAGIPEKPWIPRLKPGEAPQKPDLSTLDIDLNGLLYTCAAAVQVSADFLLF